MLRTRDLLSVTLPAALLAFAVQPLLDTAAPAGPAAIRGDRLESSAVRGRVPLRAGTVAGVVRETDPDPKPAARQAEEVPVLPVARPARRVGCEVAVSALAGREARQLLPSRCLV